MLTVDVRLDLTAEVLLVLDDAGDVEPAAGSAGDLDRVAVPLSGWMRPKNSRWSPGVGMHRERSRVDAVVDRGGVVERAGAGRRR